MEADAVVKDEILSESQSKEPKIMDNIKILGYELVLDSSAITLCAAIDLRTTRVTEPILDLHCTEICIELDEELRAVIRHKGRPSLRRSLFRHTWIAFRSAPNASFVAAPPYCS